MNSIVSFTTTRRDGNARARSTQRRLLASRRLPAEIATAEQVHGRGVIIVPKLSYAKKYPAADGLLTAAPEQPLGIFTADCVPVFLSVPSHGVVGLLHAGWRGARQGILRRALQRMRRRWGCRPQDVRVWVGPSIGACCFEVGWDVARHFPESRRRAGTRWTVNLSRAIQRQARRLGARFLQAKSASCTRHTSRYHSYRRDQTDKRQISIIMKKSHGLSQ